MVVTFFAPTFDTGIPHERTATPSIWTVQAPHCCSPHPNFVPVKPIASRITQSSGVSGLTSTSYCLPFTVNEIIGSSSQLRKNLSQMHPLANDCLKIQPQTQRDDARVR